MIEMVNQLVDILSKNLEVGMLSISLVVNVYMFLLYLKTNDKYINTLTDNIKITEKINAIMGKLKINSEIISDTKLLEIKDDPLPPEDKNS